MCLDVMVRRTSNGWSGLGLTVYSLKEVIQPHLPVRLPCYDLAPVKGLALGAGSLAGRHRDFEHSLLPWLDGRCVQGPGTYSPRYADPRLLAIPTSRRRVAACDLNWGCVFELCSPSRVRFSLLTPIVVRV